MQHAAETDQTSYLW